MSDHRFTHAPLDPADDARVRELWGRAPINLYRILAHHPSILRAWTEWNNGLRHGCALPRALRELVFLRSARLQTSAYEWTQHVAMARKAGVAEVKIDALRAGRTDAPFDARERATIDATDEITRGDLTQATFTRLAALFTASETLEIIVTAAHACMLARVIQAIGVTAEGEDAGQTAENSGD